MTMAAVKKTANDSKRLDGSLHVSTARLTCPPPAWGTPSSCRRGRRRAFCACDSSEKKTGNAFLNSSSSILQLQKRK